MIWSAAARALLAAILLASASAASAQFIELSRCQSAMPCAIPFGLRYNPDPLSTAGFAKIPSTALSLRVDPAHPLSPPKVDLSREIDKQDWAREAAKIFVLKYPRKPSPAPEPAQTPAAPEKD